METNKQIEKMEKFRLALKKVLNSEDGKIVKDMLQELYVDQSALDVTKPEFTYYRLGQKEFVQGLLKDADNDAVETVKINTGE